MGLPEAPRTVSVGLRSCYLALPRRHNFLLGFETAIWPFPAALQRLKTCKTSQQLCRETSRGAMCCFCWASKLLSGISEALQLVSIGLRNCHLARFQQPFYLALPWRHNFLSGFETATLPAALPWDSPGPTNCFCWASKLLSGTSEVPQPLSIGLRNCHLARFQHPLKALKPSQQLCHGTSRGPSNCFCWPSKLLSGPRRHNFLLGFDTAIWPFPRTP